MTLTNVTPLATRTSSDEDEVADFISGLIMSGTYRPAEYGVPPEAIRRHRKVHQYCVEHQQATGTAPQPELIRRKFPDFPLIEDMPASWAAAQLLKEHQAYIATQAVAQAGRHLIEGEVDEAIVVMKQMAQTSSFNSVQPVNMLDMRLMDAERPEPCPVGIDVLQEQTGGIVPGELWYIGARPGRGKSWDLIRHAKAATEGAWNVVLFSMEMTADQVQERYLATLFGWERVLRWRMNPEGRDEAVEAISASHGSFSAYDPGMIRCDTNAVAAAAANSSCTLLMIDYVGLMKTQAGVRSIEDHRIAAAISNELKEIAVSYKVPIMAAAQLNRGAERGTAPSLADLAQTDAAGQDADLVYSITAAPGSKVQQSTIVKRRSGPAGLRWYTEFRPDRPSFTTITRTRAQTILDNEAGALDLL